MSTSLGHPSAQLGYLSTQQGQLFFRYFSDPKWMKQMRKRFVLHKHAPGKMTNTMGKCPKALLPSLSGGEPCICFRFYDVGEMEKATHLQLAEG
ncbi:hypothetical protein BaRGS_00033632 [Batillaria attramentaria]|uniref:Uncharacterized protein n=1 Tax=Batillaria attramentaria TaxID=370345 RepID=A0ABD0JKA6_9CAEN